LSADGEGYQPIDWHSDFKVGYRWNPKTFYRNIHYGHIKGVDIKVPWELSRYQHLTILGQTYLITNDKKYLEEFVNQITDWISNNPVGFGVNWSCTMDVSIRVANWLVAIEYFSREDNLSKDFLYTFYSSVYEHGIFIRSHLEKSAINSNHYLSNIVGLFFISVYCPFFKQSNKWLAFSIKQLEKELENQVYEDGCDFEASTSYHRLVLEMVFYCNLLADRSGIALPKQLKYKLRKMFNVSLHCIKPNGMIPQIGDNDSGRFLIFAKRPILEHKYLLTLASIYYKDSSFKLPSFNFDEEAFWTFGIRGKKFYDELPLRIKPLASTSFPDAGWFIIRKNSDYCFISSGPNGQKGNGAHTHDDKLSFELMLDGQDIIVDPGTYTYTAHPKERNKFRSRKYHNTITFDNYDQNRISDDLFSLPDTIRIINAELTDTDEQVLFQGEIQYIEYLHKRIITLDKESANWQITDTFSCPNSVNGELLFHLSPDLTSNGSSILGKDQENKIASVEVEGYRVEKRQYNYSPEYGVKINAECLVVNISVNVNNEGKVINTYINKS
jgi:hypothetical protein